MGSTCREVEEGVEYEHADPKRSSESNLELAGLFLSSILIFLGELAESSFSILTDQV